MSWLPPSYRLADQPPRCFTDHCLFDERLEHLLIGDEFPPLGDGLFTSNRLDVRHLAIEDDKVRRWHLQSVS
ncbi:hypothetical protein [Nocardia sp. NPDC005745]|uniref:hypothetical protein n=1 Tax=Nocardia sp. NPDC005745 TaxID=3157061 RepID=UPI0034053BC5